MTLYIVSCIILILFVLLQPGKSDAAAVFGGGANSSAFGPRGTQSALAKITIGAAVIFFLTAFLFSIPGLFETRSVGEDVGPAQSQPAPPTPPPANIPQTPPPGESPAPPTAPSDQPATQPRAPEPKPAESAPKQDNK